MEQTVDWTKRPTKSVETRKRDIVLRISDWTRNKMEPAFDVEVYVHGIYDWNLSKTIITKNGGRTKKQAKAEALSFCIQRLTELLGE